MREARHHTLYKKANTAGRGRPDFSLLTEIVPQAVQDAMHVASARLSKAGVRHALIGGLAVGVHGYPRTTRDVDLLVGDEAFEIHPSGVVTLNSAVPIAVGTVAVDPVSVGLEEAYLERELSSVQGRVPVVGLPALVYLKLRVGRAKDKADVVGLLAAGANQDAILAYLQKHDPELLDRFAWCVQTAESEE